MAVVAGERSILDRAQAGDGAAFAELTAGYRQELHLHCYRMLGSVTDADDLLQETMVAAWRGLGGFSGRSSLRAWLYRIATHRCLNAIRDAKRRPPLAPLPPFEPPDPSRWGDVSWLQPYPDAWLDSMPDQEPGPAERYEVREALELAFIAALQRLSPRQTAVLVLCEVLGFPLADVAGMLDTTPTAAKGLLQRARVSLDRQRGTSQEPRREPASAIEQELAMQFAAAFSADNVDGVIALLTDDAWLAMPPAPHEYQGADAIGAFLRASSTGRAGQRLALVPTRANGQPAFACYLEEPDHAARQPSGIVVLTVRGNQISTITRFLDPRLHRRFHPLMNENRPAWGTIIAM